VGGREGGRRGANSGSQPRDGMDAEVAKLISQNRMATLVFLLLLLQFRE